MEKLLQSDLIIRLLIAAAIIAAFILLSRPVRWLLGAIGRRIIALTETRLDDRILEILLAHVRPVMIVAASAIALREVRKATTPADETLRQILEYGDQIVYVVFIFVALKVVFGALREGIEWYLEKTSTETGSTLRNTLGPLTTKATGLLVGMVGVIVVLDHFGINIGSLLVSLGVGSLAVALAAQETLANMIAGFVILVDRPFRVGDRIEIAPGQVGDVQWIGLRSTRVLNFDNNILIIPNSDLVKGRIINFTHPFSPTRVLLRFDVAYGVDADLLRQILLEIAARHTDVLKDPPPQVFLTALSEYAIQVSLVVRAADFTKQFATEVSLREDIYRAFLARGIAMPVPQRLLRMKENP